MAKGLSLHIGVNQVDPNHYAGWVGTLGACEADAASMNEIASSSGYESRVLRTREATRQNVQDAIRSAASHLAAGDIFLVSYAGHGGQVPDTSGDEPDFADETWCLYDGQLIDDEIHDLWNEFAAGVRVLVFSDSCHSGSVIRAERNELPLAEIEKELRALGIEKPRFRFMPPEAARDTYRANQSFYDTIGASVATEVAAPVATVRLISGCQDDQTSADGTFNGLFTGTMLRVWNNAKFEGDYQNFHDEIVKRMPKFQRPNHYVIGPGNPAFDRQKPFAI